LGKHLLTPAPDVASVNWKRKQLSKTYIGVEKDLVGTGSSRTCAASFRSIASMYPRGSRAPSVQSSKAIADDIAFLDAQPTRSSRANKERAGESR
jgi:hypothetical protein